MSKKPLLIALAMALAGTAMPALAEPGWHAGDSWNRDTFWQGAPSGVRERIDWLQRRIDRGVSDGTLDRRESRRLQVQLNDIRRDSRRMRRSGGHLGNREEAMLQDQLDNLSRQIRWQRRDGDRGYGAGGGGGYAGGGGGYRPGDRDPYATDYDATRFYRDDPRYQERRLSGNDEVYRGSDGRYYCKRNDGTTGLVIGAVGGGVVGNVIDGGHNRLAGTLIGGALGALAGKAIDQSSDVRCR